MSYIGAVEDENSDKLFRILYMPMRNSNVFVRVQYRVQKDRW